MNMIYTNLIITFTIATLSTVYAETTIFATGGFENYSDGDVVGQYGWSSIEGAGSAVIQSHTVSSGSKALEISDEYTIEASYGAITDGVIRISYDIYMENGGSNTFLAYIGVQDGSNSLLSAGMYDGGADPALLFYGDKNRDGDNQYFDEITQEHGTFNYGEWVHIEYVLAIRDGRLVSVSSPSHCTEYLRYFFRAPRHAAASTVKISCRYPGRRLYIDNLEVTYEEKPGLSLAYSADGFTDWNPGTVPGQDGWVDEQNGDSATIESSGGNPGAYMQLSGVCAIARTLPVNCTDAVQMVFDVQFAAHTAPYSTSLQLTDTAGRQLGRIFFYDGGGGVAVSIWGRNGKDASPSWIDTGITAVADDEWLPVTLTLNNADKRILQVHIDDQTSTFETLYYASEECEMPLRIVAECGEDSSVALYDNLLIYTGKPVVYNTIPIMNILSVLYDYDVPETKMQGYLNDALPRASAFWLRNSYGKFLANFIPLRRNIRPPGEHYWDSDAIVNDLRNNGGVTDDEYDVIMLIDPLPYDSPGLAGNWGGTRFGPWNNNFDHTYGCQGEDFGHCFDMPYVTWVGVHEVQHSLDSMAAVSGRSDFLHAHPDQCSYGAADGGADYSWCASILRKFTGYADYQSPWNGRYTFRDSDLDGLPDEDSLFPIDEVRFGSSPSHADTDSDGLSDLEEYYAGIRHSSDPCDTDTDNDGLIDGEDAYPLYAYKKDIPRVLKPPVIDGIIHPNEWEEWGKGVTQTDDAAFSLTSYAYWETNMLYLAFKATKRFALMFEIDQSAASGPWWGGDYFKMKNPSNTGRAYMSDGTAGPGGFTYGGVFSAARMVKRSTTDGYFLECAIPADMGGFDGYGLTSHVKGSSYYKDQVIGILLNAYNIGSGTDDTAGYIERPWSFIFEGLQFIHFTLSGYAPRIHLLNHATQEGDNTIIRGMTNSIACTFANYAETALNGTVAIVCDSSDVQILSGAVSLPTMPSASTTTVVHAGDIYVESTAPGDTDVDAKIILSQDSGVTTNDITLHIVPEPGMIGVLCCVIGVLMGRKT